MYPARQTYPHLGLMMGVARAKLLSMGAVMLAPAIHYLTTVDPRGKQVRSPVVYLQPIEERSRQERAIVYIVTSDRLGTYGHEAVYSMLDQAISGIYTPHGYGCALGHWLLMGIF